MAGWLVPLLAYTAAAGLLTVTPGVDTALVLRSAAADGARAAIGASLGISLGLLAWGSGAAFGLTAILSASPRVFAAVTWAGAAYLMCLGAGLLLRPRKGVAHVHETAASSGLAAFRRGFLTNILNPKVGVFYVTFLPQFIPRGTDVAAFSLLLALIHALLGLAWFSLLIAMTVPLGRVLARPSAVRALDRLTGCVFLAFGIRLVLQERA